MGYVSLNEDIEERREAPLQREPKNAYSTLFALADSAVKPVKVPGKRWSAEQEKQLVKLLRKIADRKTSFEREEDPLKALRKRQLVKESVLEVVILLARYIRQMPSGENRREWERVVRSLKRSWNLK